MKNLLFIWCFFAFLPSGQAGTKTEPANIEAFELQQTPHITFYWDVSFSMAERNVQAEIKYLNNFFAEQGNVVVDFVAFSNEVIAKETFEIQEGNWDRLKENLLSSQYDGATNYNVVDFSKKVSKYIISTDGSTVFHPLSTSSDVPVIVLQSVAVPVRLTMPFLDLATSSKGEYIKLFKGEGVQTDNPFYGKVYGGVGDKQGPLVDVNVRVMNTANGTVTDSDGKFEIDAQPGNVIIFSYLGKKTKRVRVAQKRRLDVNLDLDDNELLDEVILTVDKKVESTTINTGYGNINKESLGYDVQSIGDKDITPVNTNVATAIQGQFSGVNLERNADLSRITMRQAQTFLGNKYGLVVIDGIPQKRGDSSGATITGTSFNFIDPENIANITVLKGMAATNKYGSEGINGVILITTKTAQFQPGESDGPKKIGTTATYSQDVAQLSSLPDTPYIDALKITKDAETAYETYLNLRQLHGSNSEFYIDAATYFMGWGNPIIVKRILSTAGEVANGDVNDWRAIAYKYQEYGFKKEALNVYHAIYKTHLEEAQSYRDLALAYEDMGDLKSAFRIYTEINKGGTLGKANFVGIQQTTTKEYQNFIRKHKKALVNLGINVPALQAPELLDKRIVIEWNDPKASFDLQILNPQDRYFTWSHTPQESASRIEQELQQGFNLEEFFLTSSDKGLWKFNIVNYGFIAEDKGQPTFIKFTVYTNYGRPSERKVVKVVRLNEIDTPINVLQITI